MGGTLDTWFVERPVGEVRPGDHAWLPFSTVEEQSFIVGTFIHDGLTRSEKVVYVSDAPPGELPGLPDPRCVDLHRYLRTGQLRVITREQACLSWGRLDPDRMLATFEEEISGSGDEGYQAVRLTTDLSWALGKPGGARFVFDCEGRFERVVASGAKAMAICQIDRNRCTGDQLMALENTHDVLVAADPDYDDGILKITRTFAPHGLRLEGELDGARHTVVAAALSSIAGRANSHVDFSGVRFVDLGALSLLAAYGMHMPEGHPLVLDHLPPDVEAVIEILGWERLPGIVRGQGTS